jgi:hypothetical protein
MEQIGTTPPYTFATQTATYHPSLHVTHIFAAVPIPKIRKGQTDPTRSQTAAQSFDIGHLHSTGKVPTLGVVTIPGPGFPFPLCFFPLLLFVLGRLGFLP